MDDSAAPSVAAALILQRGGGHGYGQRNRRQRESLGLIDASTSERQQRTDGHDQDQSPLYQEARGVEGSAV